LVPDLIWSLKALLRTQMLDFGVNFIVYALRSFTVVHKDVIVCTVSSFLTGPGVTVILVKLAPLGWVGGCI